MPHLPIAIIGAGLAGLRCVERLVEADLTVKLFDKARGPGGRMSTRRVTTPLGETAFDHGAQYLKASDSGFAEQLERWDSDGLVARWPDAGDGAYVGIPGMNAPIKAMAAGHDIVWNSRITGLARQADVWSLVGDESQTRFGAVLLAIPAEQAAELLGPIEPEFAAIAAAVRSDPCWTVMAAFDQPLPSKANSVRDTGPIGWAARNSAKPGRSGPESWVIQANAGWSAENIEAESGWICAQLMQALAIAIQAEIMPPPISVQAHRWRYAHSGGTGNSAFWQRSLRLGICGDWLLGPKAEHAWLSGEALASDIIQSL